MDFMRTANEILDDIRRLKGLDSDAALGGLFGVKQSTVASWRSRNTLPYDDIIAFCVKENIPTDSIFLTADELSRAKHSGAFIVSEGKTEFRIEGKKKGKNIFVSSDSSDANTVVIIDEMHRAMIDLMDSAPKEKNELVALVKGYLMGKKKG